jgi:hypothetical protein
MTGWSYPLNGEVVCAERVARWRPLLGWVLVLPLFLWLLVLRFGAEVVRFLGWFAILFSGQLPKRFGDYLVAVLRYEWRVNVYLYGLTDVYPGWRIAAGYVDPGDYPAAVYSARPAVRKRATVFFRNILIIPQLLVLIVVTLAAVAVLIIAWFAVLVTGRWPKGLQTFVIGWLLWTIRVESYGFLLLDEYPPFGYESHPPPTPSESPSPPSSDLGPSGQWPPQPQAAELYEPLPPVVPSFEPIDPTPSAEHRSVGQAESVERWRSAHAADPIPSGPAVPSDLGFDPDAVSGPPWPRLVATDARYSPPRLLRWPIAVGTVLLALVLTGSALRIIYGPPLPTHRPPYVFTASDAHFTATFPGKPHRGEQTAGTTSIVLYQSNLANHSVAVGYLALPAGATFDLQAGVTGAAKGMHGTLLSHTSLIYHDQPAEDGVISVSRAVAQVRAVVFGSSVYLFEAVGTSGSAFTEDYKRLLDSFTSTTEPRSNSQPASPSAGTPTPAPSIPARSATPLAAKVVAPPDGFAISEDPQAHTGPITAAEFDKIAGKGTAASLHYVAGYQAFYDSIQDDDGIAVNLYRFASATDAIYFKAGVSQGDIDAKFKVTNYPPIPGAEVHESTVVDSSGTHEHDIIATKDDTAMIVTYIDYRPTRPPLLDLLARQQHARL